MPPSPPLQSVLHTWKPTSLVPQCIEAALPQAPPSRSIEKSAVGCSFKSSLIGTLSALTILMKFARFSLRSQQTPTQIWMRCSDLILLLCCFMNHLHLCDLAIAYPWKTSDFWSRHCWSCWNRPPWTKEGSTLANWLKARRPLVRPGSGPWRTCLRCPTRLRPVYHESWVSCPLFKGSRTNTQYSTGLPASCPFHPR